MMDEWMYERRVHHLTVVTMHLDQGDPAESRTWGAHSGSSHEYLVIISRPQEASIAFLADRENYDVKKQKENTPRRSPIFAMVSFSSFF